MQPEPVVHAQQPPETGHAAEEPTYQHRPLYDWFLTQRRGQPGAEEPSGSVLP